MRIAIVAPSSVPFRLGGAERAWNGLIRELMQNTPHQADLIKLPAPEESLLDVVRSYESFARLDLSAFDLVVTTKYPAWLAFHEEHVVYLFHPLRALYDLYPPGRPQHSRSDDLRVRPLELLVRRHPDRTLLDDVFGRFWELVDELGPGDPALTFPGPLARELVHFLDRVALDPRYVRRHLALSRTVASRRDYFPPGTSIEVLYLPPNLEGFSSRRYDQLFAPTRLEGNKRPDLLVEAMRHVKADIPLKLAGTGPDLERLQALARGDARIELVGAVSDRQILEGYADALAVPVVPLDEEYGLVTLEAMRSSKPVITCVDSGGPTELVRDGETGFVTQPTPEAIAAAIDRLAADPELARRLGEAGRVRAEPINWHRTVTNLLQPHRDVGTGERRAGRTKVVIASVGCVRRPRSAAELRTAHLARALAVEFDIEIVSLGDHGVRPSRELLRDGLVETVAPRSAAHAEHERHAGEEAGVPLRDLGASYTGRHTPEYTLALGRACRSAEALILSGPYLQPAAAALARSIDVVYYAHRVEARAWEAILPSGSGLLEHVRSLEAQLLDDAVAVLAATDADAQLLGAAAVASLGLDPRDLMPRDASARASGRNRWIERLLDTSRPSVDRLAIFLGDDSAADIQAARAATTIAEALPSVLHVIAGCRDDDLPASRPPNVALTGGLTGTMRRALLGAADVALAPVPAVREARVQLAECMAAGLPCVVTPAAAHGLAVDDGLNALVREPDGFPDAALHLLGDDPLAERLSRHGRALIEREYDAETAARTSRKAVASIIEGSDRLVGVAGS